MTRAWTRSYAACCGRKGLIFLMLCNANLQDRAVFAIWSLKVCWSSKITLRFLTELDGVIVQELSWMVKSCCRVGVAEKTRSSIFARFSCRWCSFIHKPCACMMGPSNVVYVEKRRGPITDPWGTPVTSWCSVDTSPSPGHLERPTRSRLLWYHGGKSIMVPRGRQSSDK